MKMLIGNILFLAALFLIMARFLSVWSGTPFPVDLVTSDSMSPSLMKGDVVAWTPTKMEDVEVGDVVVYKSYIRWPDEKLLVHRVTNIKKDSRGNFLLETKGDANDWVDQAGPHIPEPYIREDHLMGKAMSIGQQPLKIPFVGYIGIWITEGIESLAQPASSKESLSYIGIFTPLTISVVILVILIFVIPEKAKTIKQKIKQYVFGPKQIGLKKTLILFLAAYFVFFTLIHCFAFDSNTASVGIGEDSPSSETDFGRITKGTESSPTELPIFNPSITTVKGVIFGRGEVNEYVSRKVFELPSGESQTVFLTASAANTTQNGSYSGEIMVYSSPFWILFSDDFMQNLCNWNAEAAVFCLDFLSAVVLTTITAVLLVSITLISKMYNILSIDLSWRHATRSIIKKHTIDKMSERKRNIKRSLGKKIGWISKADIGEIDIKEDPAKSFIKPVLASLVVIPILFIISDQLIAMLLAVIITGIIAYFISCKIRRKIILTAVTTVSIAVTHMIIQSNLIIMEKDQELMETLSFSLGAIGIYLLILGLLLVPLSLISWFIVRQIRNLKERKEPLLILEGKCDL